MDLHVHARSARITVKTIKKILKQRGEAAVNGGVVAFMEMPNNPVPPIDDQSYREKKN